jgi:hypothetical protein
LDIDDENEADYDNVKDTKFTIFKSNRPNQNASERDQKDKKEVGDSKCAVDDKIEFLGDRMWI